MLRRLAGERDLPVGPEAGRPMALTDRLVVRVGLVVAQVGRPMARTDRLVVRAGLLVALVLGPNDRTALSQRLASLPAGGAATPPPRPDPARVGARPSGRIVARSPSGSGASEISASEISATEISASEISATGRGRLRRPTLWELARDLPLAAWARLAQQLSSVELARGQQAGSSQATTSMAPRGG